jgi:hypothetical protein
VVGDRDQIGNDLLERPAGIELVRAAGPEQRLDLRQPGSSVSTTR